MPLLVRALPPPAAPPPPPPPVGTLRATWITPTGQTVALTDDSPTSGWFTRPGIRGLGAVPVELITDAHPRGGAQVRHIRDEPRDVHWPLHIYGETHQEFITRWNHIVRAFTDTKRYGAGTLQVLRPDGTGRTIQGFYSQGLEGEPDGNWVKANPLVTLHCPGGYWHDLQSVELTWEHQDPVDYYDPYASLSASRVLGATTVFNQGDATAWPEWTLVGPAETLTATNVTTGKAFTLTYSLAAAEEVTITTLRPKVRGPNGEVLTSAMNWPDAVLWGLDPGTNKIDLQVTGALVGTQVLLRFVPRYESY